MATDPAADASMRELLRDVDWSRVLEGVASVEQRLRLAMPGDPQIEYFVSELTALAGHPKWEVRRAVASVAARASHPAFDSALQTLATDENAQVRQASAHAALRRRDSRNASSLGKQQEVRINATLNDIEARFGIRGREAVKRASEQIADMFARSLYHEVVKLLSPLAMSADRLRGQLGDESTPHSALLDEAVRIDRRVQQLRTVLDAMRAYTFVPNLVFHPESLHEIVVEAASLAASSASVQNQPPITIDIDPSISVEIAKGRLLQALTNLLVNAIEAYDGIESRAPVVARAVVGEGRLTLTISDSGCGIAEEDVADATALFATNKRNGTGFGLPLAIKIVESEHQGRLTLKSAAGSGTTVEVMLPITANQGAHE